jgi:hypothetical protein
MIPWENIDWDILDFANFNFSAIEWTSPDWLTTGWADIVGNAEGSVSDGVCTLMSKAVQMTEELGLEGSCTCDAANGLKMNCAFEELCTTIPDSGDGEPMCADVNVTLTYDKLAGVDSTVCLDYEGDAYQVTCFTYTIPVVGQAEQPECSATYGDESNVCQCTIDKDLCVSIDCTEFEPTAFTDTCQVVSLEGAKAESLMLQFEAPDEASSGPSSSAFMTRWSFMGVSFLLSVNLLHYYL